LKLIIMKAVTQGVMRSTEIGIKSDMYKLGKPKFDEGEMAACFLKLRELVPSVPHGKKLSKTQLLQHVIDYIYDLELSLDVPPVLFSPVSREPLAEKAEPNYLIESDEPMDDSDLEGERPASK